MTQSAFGTFEQREMFIVLLCVTPVSLRSPVSYGGGQMGTFCEMRNLGCKQQARQPFATTSAGVGQVQLGRPIFASCNEIEYPVFNPKKSPDKRERSWPAKAWWV
jgi:hypothetical protein